MAAVAKRIWTRSSRNAATWTRRTERLATFAAAVRSRLSLFTAAIDRLVMRRRENGAGDAAPKQGNPMPPFLLPDEANPTRKP